MIRLSSGRQGDAGVATSQQQYIGQSCGAAPFNWR
nr:MAG TPA: hypothetical protein [Caudoviricetes sp.]